MGAVCYRNVVIVKLKLTAVGGWRWEAWSWSPQLNALISPTGSISLSTIVTNKHTRTPVPGGKDRPCTLLPLGLCTCCQLSGDTYSISLSFWQISPPFFKCDSSMRLSPHFRHIWCFPFSVPNVPVLTANIQLNKLFVVVFIFIFPLYHNLFEGKAWICIFVSLAPITMPGIKKANYVLIH